MKKIVIIALSIWITLNNKGIASSSDSLIISEKHRITLMYYNLDARLRGAEYVFNQRELKNQELIQRIDRRLERMEDKFDKYFLWGYGTFLSIFIGVLAWFLNRFRSENNREYHQPNSRLKVAKQKYLFPS